MDPFRRALTGQPDQRSITLQRDYSTDPADLWAALTDPVRLARWFGELTEQPATVGDSFAVRLSDEPGDTGRGEILVCRPVSHLAYRWSWGDEPDSRVDVRLEPASGGVRLMLTHVRLSDRTTTGYGGGWEQLLGELGRSLGDSSSVSSESAAVAAWRMLVEEPLLVVRRFDAAPEQLWSAWTTADGLRRWWWNHWDDVEFDVDLRVGGSYAITAPQGGLTLRGSYLAIDAPQHLAFTWQWVDTDGESRDEACDLLLEADGNSTALTLRHTGPWTDSRGAENYRIGWEQTLARLTSVFDEQ